MVFPHLSVYCIRFVRMKHRFVQVSVPLDLQAVCERVHSISCTNLSFRLAPQIKSVRQDSNRGPASISRPSLS